MKRTWSAIGPGKVILLGEHGVVYGQPALAGAISRGVKATAVESTKGALSIPKQLNVEHRRVLSRAFDRALEVSGSPKVRVTLESELPPSMGLGSSGALSVAVSRVLYLAKHGVEASAAKVEAMALEMEREFHGTPSGVDHTTSARGQLVLFRRGRATSVRCPVPLKVLIAIVGQRTTTKVTVAGLRARQQRAPERHARLFREIGRLASAGAKAASAGDLEEIGALMNVNQGLLAALGLSSASVEAMVYRLRALGALGAKLTGAGGDGGAVIGLFREPEQAVRELRRAGVECFASQLAGPVAL